MLTDEKQRCRPLLSVRTCLWSTVRIINSKAQRGPRRLTVSERETLPNPILGRSDRRLRGTT